MNNLNAGDLNEDGTVNITDLNLIIMNWNNHYLTPNNNLVPINVSSLNKVIMNWNEEVEDSDNENNNDDENQNIIANFINNSGLNPGDEFYVIMGTTNTTNLLNVNGQRNQNIDTSLFWNNFVQNSYLQNGSILGNITVKAFVATSDNSVPRNINYLGDIHLNNNEVANPIPVYNLMGQRIFDNANQMWNINNHHGENIGYNDSNEHMGYNQDMIFWTGMEKNGEKHIANPVAYTFENYLLPAGNPLRVGDVMCGWPWRNNNRHNFEFTSRPGDEMRHVYSFTQRLRIGEDGESIEEGSIDCPCITLSVIIGNNHNHNLEIPCGDVVLQRERTYTLEQGGHNHEITITPQNFSDILRNGSIVKNTNIVNNHSHEVTITCVNNEPIAWELVMDQNNIKSFVILNNNEEIDLDIEISSLYLTKTTGIMLAGLSDAGEQNELSKKTIYSTDNGLTWRVCGDGEGNNILPLGVTEFMQGYGEYNWAVFAAAENGVFHSTDEGVHWKKFHFNVINNNVEIANENTSIQSLGMPSSGEYLLLSTRVGGIIYKFNIKQDGIYSDINNPISGTRIFNKNGIVTQFITNKVNGVTYFICDQNHDGVADNQQDGGIYSFIDQVMNNIQRLPIGNNNTLKISNVKRIIVTEDFNCDIYVGLLGKVGKYTTANSTWNSEFISTTNFPDNYYINRFISNEINPPYISNSEYPYWINDIYNNNNNNAIKLQPNLPSPVSYQANQMIFGKDGRIYLSILNNDEGNILYRSVNPMNNNMLPNFVNNFN